MSMKAYVFTKRGATGLQAITGIGFRPTWVLLFWNGCTALNTLNEGFAIGYGCAVLNTGLGEGQACTWGTMNDGPVTYNPDGSRIDRYTSIFVKTAAAPSGTPTKTDEAVLSSMDVDGFTLNWTTNSGSLDLILAVCGSHSLAAMDNVSLFLGSPAAVTDLGFTPTAMISMMKRTTCVGTACVTSLASGSSSANGMTGGIGIVDQADLNEGIAWCNANSGGLASWKSTGGTPHVAMRFADVDGTLGFGNDYLQASLDSDGYSFAGFALATPTWIQSFLLLGGAQSKVGHQTGSGSVSPGFTPGLAIMLGGGGSTMDLSIGVYDGTNHYALTATSFYGSLTPPGETRTAKEFSSGKAVHVLNPAAATATSTTTKQTVTAAFSAGSVTFTKVGSTTEFMYLLLEDPIPSSHNLLTGSSHNVQGSDNLIAGYSGTVIGDRNALFALNAGSPAAEITADNIFKVVADEIDLESNVLAGSGHVVDGSDNLIVGAHGTVIGDTNALFALGGDSPAPEIAGDHTFKVRAGTIDLSADTLLLNGVAPSQIQLATVTLTDAQIKALPTTPITIVAATGAGRLIQPMFAYLWAKTASGAYTNINSGGFLTVRVNGFGGMGFVPNDASIAAGSKTRLSDFLGTTTPQMTPLAAYFDTEGVDGWGPVGVVQPSTAGVNQPLEITIDNGGSGNLTGGNAANSLIAMVTYLEVAVP